MRNSAILMCLVFVSGCGGDSGGAARTTVYPVSGKVTIQGSPIAGVTVSFAPLEKGTPVAVGRTGDDGVYYLRTYEGSDGAGAGKFNVLISKTEVQNDPLSEEAAHGAMQAGGGPPTHGSSDKGAGKSLINEKYSKAGNGLTAEVTADGPNEFDFPLDP